MTEGEDHRILKEKVADLYREKGYEVELEKRLSSGIVVDVYADNNDETVGIEIGRLEKGRRRKREILEVCDKFLHYPQFDKNYSSGEFYHGDESTFLGVRVSSNTERAIEDIVDGVGLHTSKSDFVRDVLHRHIHRYLGEEVISDD